MTAFRQTSTDNIRVELELIESVHPHFESAVKKMAGEVTAENSLSLLQEKLYDLSRRFAHEARWVTCMEFSCIFLPFRLDACP